MICEVKALLEFSREASFQFNQALGKDNQKECQNISWVKPPVPYVKINCDGAQKDSGCAGAGCMLRDSNGKSEECTVNTITKLVNTIEELVNLITRFVIIDKH